MPAAASAAHIRTCSGRYNDLEQELSLYELQTKHYESCDIAIEQARWWAEYSGWNYGHLRRIRSFQPRGVAGRPAPTVRVRYRRVWKHGCHIQRVTLRANFRYQPNTRIRFVHLVGAGCP